MNKISKQNIKRRTRRNKKGGVQGTLKKFPPLPESPSSTPSSSPKPMNTKKPEIKVENINLKPIEPYTHNWWKRQVPKKVLEKAGQPPYWKKLLGIKNKKLNAVPLNSYGFPKESYFKPNNAFKS